MPNPAVEFAPRAERQLAQIENYYLREAGTAVADDAVAAIINAAERLATLPVIYRAAARAGLREYVMPRFPYILLQSLAPKNSNRRDHSSAPGSLSSGISPSCP